MMDQNSKQPQKINPQNLKSQVSSQSIGKKILDFCLGFFVALFFSLLFFFLWIAFAAELFQLVPIFLICYIVIVAFQFWAISYFRQRRKFLAYGLLFEIGIGIFLILFASFFVIMFFLEK